MNKYQSDDYRRDELIRIIEHSVEKLTLQELEALYYDMTTKSYINDWMHDTTSSIWNLSYNGNRMAIFIIHKNLKNKK